MVRHIYERRYFTYKRLISTNSVWKIWFNTKEKFISTFFTFRSSHSSPGHVIWVKNMFVFNSLHTILKVVYSTLQISINDNIVLSRWKAVAITVLFRGNFSSGFHNHSSKIPSLLSDITSWCTAVTIFKINSGRAFPVSIKSDPSKWVFWIFFYLVD